MDKKTIRIDDYPIGDPTKIKTKVERDFWISKCLEFLNLFEEHKIDYILGVTPRLVREEDIAKLNDTVNHGKIVMHGFSHAFQFVPWSDIKTIWKDGGEFSLYRKQEMSELYKRCLGVLSKIKRFDPTAHIPPFNCFNQDFVDVFEENGGELILGCDKEFVNYEQDRIKLTSCELSLSRWQISYGDIDMVIRMYDEINFDKEHVTLHWMYDVTRRYWKEEYISFFDLWSKK